MRVNLNSTATCAELRFSQSDTLVVKGKIQADGIFGAALHVYADVANAQDIEYSAWRGATSWSYTVHEDGLITIKFTTNVGTSSASKLTVSINNQKLTTINKSNTYNPGANIPVKNMTYLAVV